MELDPPVNIVKPEGILPFYFPVFLKGIGQLVLNFREPPVAKAGPVVGDLKADNAPLPGRAYISASFFASSIWYNFFCVLRLVSV
ncbi:MAG: hypothetical protein LBU19_06180 [Treponema sp.]|nr:hypothetical protein [Treponema sp.]